MYDAGVALPVDRLALELPGGQGLLRVSIDAWLPAHGR